VQLVACSTPSNAKALLKSAIRSDNPIVFFEVRPCAQGLARHAHLTRDPRRSTCCCTT
jgi:pyruvate/2-oxoglutarate/acetoin dehydrogenase E1 component